MIVNVCVCVCVSQRDGEGDGIMKRQRASERAVSFSSDSSCHICFQLTEDKA